MLSYVGKKEDLSRTDCIFEPKLDGFRALCYVNHTVYLKSRTGRDMTKQFPEFNFRKYIKAKSCIIDGEIVVYDQKGNPNFNLLQLHEGLTPHQISYASGEKRPATFVVFDILEKNGKSLCNYPLMERKKILQKTIKNGDGIELIAYTNDGKKLWQLMKKRGLEGVMIKQKESFYYPSKRTSVWLKLKFSQSIDCVIIGYTQEKRLISSLALGVYHNKKLIYLSKVGTGFNEQELRNLYAQFSLLKTDKPPVTDCPFTTIIWVKPKLVCEVKYFEITKDRHLRKPVFIRLRTDKLPKNCTL